MSTKLQQNFFWQNLQAEASPTVYYGSPISTPSEDDVTAGAAEVPNAVPTNVAVEETSAAGAADVSNAVPRDVPVGPENVPNAMQGDAAMPNENVSNAVPGPAAMANEQASNAGPRNAAMTNVSSPVVGDVATPDASQASSSSTMDTGTAPLLPMNSHRHDCKDWADSKYGGQFVSARDMDRQVYNRKRKRAGKNQQWYKNQYWWE
eukprot:s598_g5.t1